MPSSFVDSKNLTWTVQLDAPTIRQVQKDLAFDLLADDAYSKLADDDLLLVDCLFVICRSQNGGVTDAEFGRSLASGEVIEAAANALIQARRDFFRPGKRSLLQSLEEQQAATMAEGIAKAKARISDPELRAKIVTKMEAEIDEALAKFGSISASNSQASAESVPTA